MITRTRKFKPDVAQIVTDQIMEALERGVVPWKKPWKAQLPQNMVSKMQYHGINLLLLSLSPYANPYFLTFNQIAEMEGAVIAGSHGYRVIFWRMLEHVSPDGEVTEIPLMKYYTVFNLEQCVGIPESRKPKTERLQFNPIEACEEVVEFMPEKPSFMVSNAAYYNRKEDAIGLPAKELFVNEEEYYSTMFHEMVHSTAHTKRLNRDGEQSMAYSEKYSMEELIAEIGSSFLSAHTGIAPRTIENQASYIAGWLKVLKGDKRFILSASAAAQKAVDYIMDEHQLDYNKCTWKGDYHECHERT